MSTPLPSATLRAPASARTLKPITNTLGRDRQVDVDSLIPPTPAYTSCTRTSSVESLSSEDDNASCEPCTSVLMMMGRIFDLARRHVGKHDFQLQGGLYSQVWCCGTCQRGRWRFHRARRSSAIAMKSSARLRHFPTNLEFQPEWTARLL